MERLTYRDKDGFPMMKKRGGFKQGGVERLAAYEDTGLTPSDIADLRNELCLRCGQYKAAHIGACDGCRWKKGE